MEPMSFSQVENVLNEFICSTWDIPKLKVALNMREVGGITTKIDYDLSPLLHTEAKLADNKELCEVVQVLSKTACHDPQYQAIVSYVLKTIEDNNSEKLPNQSNLFVLLINCTENQNEIEYLNQSMAKADWRNFFVKFCLDSKKFHVCKKFLSILDMGNLKATCNVLWGVINGLQNLEMLCYFFDFLNSALKLVQKEDFWELLQSNTYSALSKQKLVFYLIDRGLSCLFNTHKMFATPKKLISFDENNFETIKNTWENYILLFEVSVEKQLHLVKPSLNRLATIDILHFSWLENLFKNYLKHSQQQVIVETLKILLKQEWYLQKEIFKQTIVDILLAINQVDTSENIIAVCKELEILIKKLPNDYLNEFIDIFITINFNACIHNFLLKSIININRISGASCLKLWKHSLNVPHLDIRDFNLEIIYKYICSIQLKLITIEDVIKLFPLSEEYCGCKYYLDHLQPLIQTSNVDQNNSNSFRVLTVFKYKIKQIDKETLEKILNDDQLNYETKDYIAQYLEKNDNLCRSYIIKRLDCIKDTQDITCLLKCIKTTVFYVRENVVMHQLCYKIVMNPDDYSTNQVLCSFIIVFNTYDYNIEEKKTVLHFWEKRLLHTKVRYNVILYVVFCKNYFQDFNATKFLEPTLYEVVNMLIEVNSPQVVESICCYLLKIYNHLSWNEFSTCLNKILNFILLNKLLDMLNILGLIRSLTDIINKNKNEAELQELIKVIDKSLTEMGNSLQFSHLRCTLVEIKNQSLLIPAILEIYLKINIVYKKIDKLEYDTKKLNSGGYYNDSKFNILDFISIFGKENATLYTKAFINKYKEHFKKRYFLNSQIHFQKLRILQALLCTYDKISNEDQSDLLNFAMDCLENENHQTDIKQLLQLLIIRLARKNVKFCQEIFTNIENSENSNHLTAIIPILYQIVEYMEQEDCEKLTKFLLRHTIGPLFLLRLYAQLSFVKSYEKICKKSSKNYKDKYEIMYDSVKNILENNEQQLKSTLKQNMLYFNLDVFRDDKLDNNIFIKYIPQLNGVHEAEYYNSKPFEELHDFKKFSDEIKQISVDAKIEDDCNFTVDVQKKIIPWKGDKEQLDEDIGDLIVVTSLIKNGANVGGLSRTCEIFNVKRLVVDKKQIVAEKDFKNLSMSSEGWLDICEVKENDLEEYIVAMKQKNYQVIGLEQTTNSVSLEKFDLPKKLVILLGNEKQGISPKLIPLLDACVEIPQLGNTRSLNVHVAGAIIIWEYTKKYSIKS